MVSQLALARRRTLIKQSKHCRAKAAEQKNRFPLPLSRPPHSKCSSLALPPIGPPSDMPCLGQYHRLQPAASVPRGLGLEGSVLLICGNSGTDPTAIFVVRRAGASRKSLIFSTFVPSRGLQAPASSPSQGRPRMSPHSCTLMSTVWLSAADSCHIPSGPSAQSRSGVSDLSDGVMRSVFQSSRGSAWS